MNRCTKEYIKLIKKQVTLKNEYNRLNDEYQDAYNLYNTHCESIKKLNNSISLLKNKYSKRWDILYKGLSFFTLVISFIIISSFNLGLLPSLISSLMSTYAMYRVCIDFSDKISKLPIFSRLKNNINKISLERQEVIYNNEDVKSKVANLCGQLDKVEKELSFETKKIEKFETNISKLDSNLIPIREDDDKPIINCDIFTSGLKMNSTTTYSLNNDGQTHHLKIKKR